MSKSGDIVPNIPICFQRCKRISTGRGIFLSVLPVSPLPHISLDKLVGDAVEEAGGTGEDGAGGAVEDVG
jgi:hypothetical protein